MPGIAIIIPRSGGTGPVIPDWTPGDLGDDLFAWYDPRQGVHGSTVTSLTSTGSGPTLDSITGTPTFDRAGMSGTPSIAFNGSSAISGPVSLGQGPLTVMANISFTGSGTQYAFDGHGVSTLSIARSVWADAFQVKRGGSPGLDRSPSDSQPHSHIAVFDGASSRYDVDGSGVEGPTNALSITRLAIGSAGDASAFLTGHVGDVLIASRALTPDEVAEAGIWLKARRNA